MSSVFCALPLKASFVETFIAPWVRINPYFPRSQFTASAPRGLNTPRRERHEPIKTTVIILAKDNSGRLELAPVSWTRRYIRITALRSRHGKSNFLSLSLISRDRFSRPPSCTSICSLFPGYRWRPSAFLLLSKYDFEDYYHTALRQRYNCTPTCTI